MFGHAVLIFFIYELACAVITKINSVNECMRKKIVVLLRNMRVGLRIANERQTGTATKVRQMARTAKRRELNEFG